MSIAREFTKGLWEIIPPFRLVLGLCPTLAVTTSAENGMGMGLATTFVLVCSNLLVSLLRKIIPSKVRIAAYIVIIASFVVIVELMHAGLRLPAVPGPGHLHPPDRGQLHHPGPGRGLCRQKTARVPSIADGLGGGHRLHPEPDRAGRLPRDSGQRHHLGGQRSCSGTATSPSPVHGAGAGRLRGPGSASWRP